MTDVKWWDFTIPEDAVTDEQLQSYLDELCTKWAYEHEIGAGGFRHIQGRCVFNVGKQLGTIKNQIPIASAHWSKTQSKTRNFDYVEKDGCAIRSWEGALRKYATLKLRPWQEQLELLLQHRDDRTVHVIFNEEGNVGKSTFVKYICATHQGVYIPPMGDAQDIMAMAMAKPSKCYVIDMPRTESVNNKKGMWSAIEQLKNGYLYDKRYNYRDMWIEPPTVAVFTNELPETGYLSKDRWRISTIEQWGDEQVLLGIETE